MHELRVDRRGVLRAAVILGSAAAVGAGDLGWAAGAEASARPAAPSALPATWATRWLRATYDAVWLRPDGLTPPAAARAYAAVSIAAYEAVVAGMPQHQSLGRQLTGLPRLPRPRGVTDWPVAIAAAVSTVGASVLGGDDGTSQAILSTTYDDVLAERRAAGASTALITDSIAHGRAVGAALVRWFDADGYAGTVGRSYTPPVGDSLWVSTPPNFGAAIEPHWSQVRPMVLRDSGEVAPAPHVPFSTEVGSPFWQQAKAPYDQSFTNTDDHRAIARFWTDNPRLSGLPAGHWMLIVAQVAEAGSMDLGTTVEVFARTGVALHEAFLSCWTWKYRLNLLRPVTYVRRHIDPAWSTLVNTPQFPEYTSGHSVASRAASTVLTELLGDVSFTDDSHRDRGMAARSFASFTAAADEAAQSRLYGGIHFPMGIDAGKDQGDEIGRLVIARLRTRRRR